MDSKSKVLTKNDSLYTKTYEGLQGTFKDVYLHDSLISHNLYDSLGVLKYKTPIDLTKIGKTKIKFVSGRIYFDWTKIDTLEVINENLPFYNRGIHINGSQLIFLKENFYKIKASTKTRTTPKQLTLYIDLYQHLEDSIKFPPLTFDSITILVK